MTRNARSIFIVLLTAPLITSAANSAGDTAISSDTAQHVVKSNKKREKKKERKRKREMREKIVIDKKASMAIHESMLSTANHKHGFSHLKVHRGKGPLKPQTFCPVMGGPIDSTIYIDYNGIRVYFCCEGCKYNFMLTPNLYIKTLKRYGEKPGKIPEE